MPGLVIASITSAHFTYFTKADDTLAASRSRLPAAINKVVAATNGSVEASKGLLAILGYQRYG